MATQYTGEAPMPWCSSCRTHHVLKEDELCPLCTDAPPLPLVGPLPPVPAPRHPAWIEKLLRGRTVGDGRG